MALQLSATKLRPKQTLTAEWGHTHGRISRASVSFGDRTKPAKTRGRRRARHRYMRKGRYVVTLRVRFHGGRQVTTRRRVTIGDEVAQAIPRAGTVEVAAADVADVTGDPAATQTLTLEASSPHPKVRQTMVVPSSARVPDGALGRVLSVRPRAGGKTAVRLAPATLDEAYSKVEYHVSGSLAGDAAATAAAAPHAANPAASFHVGGSGIRCSGSVVPQASVDLDLSRMRYDLDFIPDLRQIAFTMYGRPKVSLSAGLAGRADCHLTLPLHVVIPVGGALVVKVSPILEIGATGSLSAALSWEPSLAFGFSRSPYGNSDTRTFNPGTPGVGFRVAGGDRLFLGARAQLSLGGRVGVGADVGPEFTFGAESFRGQTCVTGDVGLKVSASVSADVFIKHWTFGIVSATFLKHDFFHPQCSGAGTTGASTGPGGTTGPPPPESGAASQPPASSSTWAGPIVINESINGVRLGDAPSQVLEAVGEPLTRRNDDFDPDRQSWLYPETSAVYFLRERVWEVFTRSTGARTDRGVGPGSTLDEVQKAYPEVNCEPFNPEYDGGYDCTFEGGRTSDGFFIQTRFHTSGNGAPGSRIEYVVLSDNAS